MTQTLKWEIFDMMLDAMRRANKALKHRDFRQFARCCDEVKAFHNLLKHDDKRNELYAYPAYAPAKNNSHKHFAGLTITYNYELGTYGARDFTQLV